MNKYNNNRVGKLLFAIAFTFLSCSEAERGEPGEDGEDGISCTLNGNILTCGEKTLTIRDGEKGEAGSDGKPGENGASVSCEIDIENEGTENEKKFLDCGDAGKVEIEDGEDGAPGEAGVVCSLIENETKLKCGEVVVPIGDDGNQQQTLKKASVSGISQKGPFIKGSSVTVFELDEDYAQTGKSFIGTINSNDGKFEVNSMYLSSPYVIFKADGFYLNEVTGKESLSQITLYAISDLSELFENEDDKPITTKVNINLLTHLEYYRVIYILEHPEEFPEITSLTEAKAHAQKEILKEFGITLGAGEQKNSEDMDISKDGALLAISVLMLGDRSDAEFTKILSDLNFSLRENGTWNNSKEKVKIADWAFATDFAGIRKNITDWDLGKVPDDFEEKIENYWRQNYGLGECNAENTVKQVNNENSRNFGYYFICKTTNSVGARQWRLLAKEKNGWCYNNRSTKECGMFADVRDYQYYSWVKINNKIWMVDDLKFSNMNGNYDWATAMNINAGYNSTIYGSIVSGASCYISKNKTQCYYPEILPHQGICPRGWHIPTNTDWQSLEDVWVANRTSFNYSSEYGYWSATEYYDNNDTNRADYWNVDKNVDDPWLYNESTVKADDKLAVRCVKD